MKTNRSVALVVRPLLVAVLLGGCTGTMINVKPDPTSMKITVSRKCGRVAIKEITPDRIYPAAGNLVPDFAKELQRSGLFEEVYFPTMPEEKADLTLDSKFNVQFIRNWGNPVKTFVTGLSLFILEPVFWYDFKYSLDCKVDVYAGKVIVKTIDAAANAEMKMKFLSIYQAVDLEKQTLNSAKMSIYKQIIVNLSDYCANK